MIERNNDGDKTIWCYTTDPEKRFEYCEPLKENTKDAGKTKQCSTERILFKKMSLTNPMDEIKYL